MGQIFPVEYPRLLPGRKPKAIHQEPDFRLSLLASHTLLLVRCALLRQELLCLLGLQLRLLGLQLRLLGLLLRLL
ncbi:MAG TPA: hypothetical protein PLA94_23525, partial [Myxococcota bacterium]|nr:hypothetical protein [Myxococcota bacterium]